MTFSDYLLTEGLTEAVTKKYFLLYHVNTQKSGKETHNYYVWSVEDIQKFSSYARGSTMKDCVKTLNAFFEKKTSSFNKIELIGKVSGIEGPVSTDNPEKPCRTKEKAELALKKLCPKAIQVLRRDEAADDEEDIDI